MQGMQSMQKMDADEDGAVSKEEFMQAHAQMFASMDGDGNGALSAQERTAMMGEMGKAHEHRDQGPDHPDH
jgi:Ca2+-binding EF-hand superfamily protein